MKIKVSIIGVSETMPPNEVRLVEADSMTVRELLDSLSETAESVCRPDGLREGYCLLVNGRNTLSLPDKLQTNLQDGDEVMLTVQVTGG